MGHYECGHIPLHVYEQFLIPSDPGSPKLRMVSWNLNTKSVPAIIKDTNMTTGDLVYIPYMESIWDRHFLKLGSSAWLYPSCITWNQHYPPLVPYH